MSQEIHVWSPTVRASHEMRVLVVGDEDRSVQGEGGMMVMAPYGGRKFNAFLCMVNFGVKLAAVHAREGCVLPDDDRHKLGDTLVGSLYNLHCTIK
jgi:hypothetical protein